MYDDGSTVEIFPDYYSGDEISDDGNFSVQIPIFGPENPSNQTNKTTTTNNMFVFRHKTQMLFLNKHVCLFRNKHMLLFEIRSAYFEIKQIVFISK